jgi:hypothetical protein
MATRRTFSDSFWTESEVSCRHCLFCGFIVEKGIHSWLGTSCRSGKFLLALASTAILGPEFRCTDDHIVLSHDSGSRATEYTSCQIGNGNLCCVEVLFILSATLGVG